MKDTYSLYEAKARLSALVRMVRDGGRVIITVHGEPAAELRPISPTPAGIEARVADLVQRGIVTTAVRTQRPIRIGPKRPGALKRFLASRD
jgi:prevent-host-death family protein